MLFTPVPSTRIFAEHLPYFHARGWDTNLHMLNGKLFPFLDLNEGSISDYIDLQRLMFMLNAHYRSESFRVFGSSRVSRSLLENVRNGFEGFVSLYRARGLALSGRTESGPVGSEAHQDGAEPGALDDLQLGLRGSKL
jgi:hypothetical protein